MTGSLQVKRGFYYFVFSYKDDTGAWKQSAENTHIPERGGKRKAQEALNQRLDEMRQQSTAALLQKNRGFLDFMRDWLDEIMVSAIRENTLDQYRKVFENNICKYQPFQGVTLQNVTPALIQSYVNERVKGGLSPKSVRKYWSNIHKCLDYAVTLDLLPYNPADRITLPKLKKYQGSKALTPAQLQTLLDVFKGDPLEVVVWLAVTYGMRRSEICGLRWDALDFDAGTLYVCHTAIKCKGEVIYSDNTKTATSRRHLPLAASMRAYLQDVRKKQEENQALFGREYVDSGYVCTKADGSPVDPDFVTHHFQRVAKAHGLPCRFHDLRHSAVNTLRKGGCDAKDIQSFLGHSDVSTTLNIYGHLMDGDMSRMGAIMDAALFQNGKAG